MNKLSRRGFIARAALASSGAALCTPGPFICCAAEKPASPIVVFSKVYQTLKLNFDDAAAVTAEAGLDGIDCPVRPGGEVLPERAAEDLPRYAEALRKRSLELPLLTTGITSGSSPHAETLLRTAKNVGVQFYRLGFVNRKSDVPVEKQLREFKAALKDVAALNRQIGIGAVFQNHSPSGQATYLGGNLADLREIVSGFDPSEIGVAFDIGHALVVHGDDWRAHFEKLKSHIQSVYIKDVTRKGRWVPFGEGGIAATGYFKLLKEMGYRAPISLHVEFDWTDKNHSKTRPALVKTLKESSRVLKHWLATA